MKRLLLLATCLLNTLAFASGWNPEYDEDTVFVDPEAVESYEMGDVTWNRYVAAKEDWTLEDAIAFEIAMPSHKDCACESQKRFCECETVCFGDYDVNPNSGKSTLSWLLLWMEKTTDGPEGPAFGCTLLIEREDLWEYGLESLVLYCKINGHEVIQSQKLNDNHFVGFVECRLEDYLATIDEDVPCIDRIYLAKNGELYFLSTTFKDPKLREHFFESFKILD